MKELWCSVLYIFLVLLRFPTCFAIIKTRRRLLLNQALRLKKLCPLAIFHIACGLLFLYGFGQEFTKLKHCENRLACIAQCLEYIQYHSHRLFTSFPSESLLAGVIVTEPDAVPVRRNISDGNIMTREIPYCQFKEIWRKRKKEYKKTILIGWFLVR